MLNKIAAINYAGKHPEEIDTMVDLTFHDGRKWTDLHDMKDVDAVGVTVIETGGTQDYQEFLVDLAKVIVDSQPYTIY